jgi:hypothetical protein
MAKARPIIPGHPPNTPGDPRPNPGNPRPPVRNDAFKEIGQKIIDEWRNAVAENRSLDRDHLEAEISSRLRLDDPDGSVEIGIIVDPKPDKGKKFVWIVIPYPDAPQGTSTQDWIDTYDQDEELKTALGEAVLFGCGR